ncbi:MAG: GIY-YIG nuclease family protein [Alphaproteobacteria bacterium]|nr:GIY-YIG nuclease family protein [Alphaproteobacteria bacterium]
MFYVYLIKSEKFPEQRYIGFSTDLKQRISDHNAGFSKHTCKYMPWKIVTYLAFSDEQAAKDFEKYLKGGSGQTFANKRFWRSHT